MSIFKNQVIKGFLTASVLSTVLMNAAMAQASDWGELKDNGCVDIGNGAKAHSFSAILWNIPWGESWEAACSGKDGWVGSHYFSHPTACVKTSVASALGTIGLAVGAAGLFFPPAGVAGVLISSAATTLDLGGWGALNMWGVFYVRDESCGI